MQQAGVTPDQLGFIVVGTTTPDTIFPSTACVLQTKIGANNAWGFDLGAACSGFTYALTTGMQMVASGAHDYALVVGADVMSSIIDYRDRTTCVLFGDGAGAVVLAPAAEDEAGIIDFAHEIDGTGGPALCMPAGGSRMPASHDTVEQRLHYVKQDGQAVFKFAVRKTEEIARRLLARNGIDASELDLFVSHQANRRIITAAAQRLGLPESKVVINLEMYGNTTAATIPLALADAIREGKLKRGDLVLLASSGASVSWPDFTVGSSAPAIGACNRLGMDAHRLPPLARELRRPPRQHRDVGARDLRPRRARAEPRRRSARRSVLVSERSVLPRQAGVRQGICRRAGACRIGGRERSLCHHAQRRAQVTRYPGDACRSAQVRGC